MKRDRLLQDRRILWEQISGALLAVTLVAIVTVMIVLTLLVIKIDHVSMLYLIPVLIAVLRWGTLAAICAAVVAIGTSAFLFYPPIYDFRVYDPNQVIDLALFIVVALVIGHLARTVRQSKSRTEAESLRDALIGSVSHELRTPLASIVGSASVLARSPKIAGDEHLSALLGVVRNEADRLNGHIQNLLDATRISSEGIKPRLQWSEPEDILNAALERKRVLLASRKVHFVTADDMPLIFVDAAMLETALGQLIENAVKYSPEHSTISIAATSDGRKVTLSVQDEGAGLTAEEAARVFERLYRSERLSSSVTGSGLGLWIAKSLVEACRGTIWAGSAGPGRGTLVKIELPQAEQPPADEHADD